VSPVPGCPEFAELPNPLLPDVPLVPAADPAVPPLAPAAELSGVLLLPPDNPDVPLVPEGAPLSPGVLVVLPAVPAAPDVSDEFVDPLAAPLVPADWLLPPTL
jgi:hypothetical protein